MHMKEKEDREKEIEQGSERVRQNVWESKKGSEREREAEKDGRNGEGNTEYRERQKQKRSERPL